MSFKLCDSDFYFMKVVWEAEPVNSGKLVQLCSEKLGWKKSTTYTMIKKMSQKGFLKNENATVTSLISKQEVEKQESDYFVERTFEGSLPGFLAAFMKGRTISEQEAEELKQMIKIGERITIEGIALTKEQLEAIGALSHVYQTIYENQKLVVCCSLAKQNLIRVLHYLEQEEITFGKIFSELPTLNDVFLEITGKELRD